MKQPPARRELIYGEIISKAGTNLPPLMPTQRIPVLLSSVCSLRYPNPKTSGIPSAINARPFDTATAELRRRRQLAPLSIAPLQLSFIISFRQAQKPNGG